MSRSIKTAKDLDNLPSGTIIRDRHGDAYQYCHGQWFAAAEPWESDEVLEFAPIAVVGEGPTRTALAALLVELDARPTITTTYGNAAHLIRQALEADKDQP